MRNLSTSRSRWDQVHKLLHDARMETNAGMKVSNWQATVQTCKGYRDSDAAGYEQRRGELEQLGPSSPYEVIDLTKNPEGVQPRR